MQEAALLQASQLLCVKEQVCLPDCSLPAFAPKHLHCMEQSLESRHMSLLTPTEMVLQRRLDTSTLTCLLKNSCQAADL